MSKIITTPDGRVLEPVTPSNDLQKLQEISEKLISDTTYQQILNNNTSMNMFDYMQKFPSPEERLKFLTDKMDSMQKRYYLASKFRDLGQYVLVKEYLKYDEDGQVQVAQTRLMGIE